MGAVAYLFSDYIKNLAASAISITSEDSNYPETNLQNEQVALCTRTTAKAAIKFRFDLGSAKALQAFFIGNHNFSGGTFDINSYTAADYVTGKTTVETKTVRLLDVYHYESVAPAARQYWEFDFSSCTSADSFFEIGRIMAYDGSNPVQLTFSPDYITRRGYGYRNIVNETAAGVRWVHKLAERRERFGLSWNERLAQTATTEVRTLYEAVYGDAHPFVYIPDITATACYYVYIESPEMLYQEIYGVGSSSHAGGVTLNLIEAVRGKV
jgi:hypothetical protein